MKYTLRTLSFIIIMSSCDCDDVTPPYISISDLLKGRTWFVDSVVTVEATGKAFTETFSDSVNRTFRFDSSQFHISNSVNNVVVDEDVKNYKVNESKDMIYYWNIGESSDDETYYKILDLDYKIFQTKYAFADGHGGATSVYTYAHTK